MVSKEELQKVLSKARSLKAMVIGDAMLDKYMYGSVDRISPEAPVPVVNLQRTEIKAGGSANVALNLAAWGCKTFLAGLVGNDEHAQQLNSILSDKGISGKLIVSEGRPTTVKTRVVAASHHLIRIDQESSKYLDGEEEISVIRQIASFLEEVNPDIIILEDYNKGMLTRSLIQEIIRFAEKREIFIAIDPKEENFSFYHHISLFKPNLREASHAAQKQLTVSDLEGLAKEWRKTGDMKTVAITLGNQGIYLQDSEIAVQVLPERSVDIVDVCGAGDAVICALSLGLIAGLPIRKIGELGNLTGAYVCSHSGVVAVDIQELMNWMI